MIEIIDAGLLLTVQDLGRAGHAHLGVPRSGALDMRSLRRANALVGNAPGAAALEATMTGVVLRAHAALVVGVAGAAAAVFVGDVPAPVGRPMRLAAGQVLDIGPATAGARTYVAARGGIDVAPVLGSRATDTLSGIGPSPLATGDRLAVGESAAAPQELFAAASGAGAGAAEHPAAPDQPVTLRMLAGPRADWADATDLAELAHRPFVASERSNRVGLRLTGATVGRARDDELPSEGLVVGAVQLPPSGEPVVFLADHPTTGGYPVIGVLDSASIAAAAQVQPGQRVRLVLASSRPDALPPGSVQIP
ncbi:biotin-dependent carboxyltransferase family protein [Demequina sp. NBRC 110051]|uniref:5-oxoprolinase subunit C family protein n=1 Tax=Demequina sp. NBRC 110051 TaxID=1570340 RepID=UPI00117E6BB4|nr:biotin-dependent carboxyltransferase family protein [Demequina sp. NBRC 110051]